MKANQHLHVADVYLHMIFGLNDFVGYWANNICLN